MESAQCRRSRPRNGDAESLFDDGVFGRQGVWLFLAAFTMLGLIGSGRMPLIDRDEGWYAEVSRTMLEQGDWVVPRFRGEVFTGKPVLAFWCQAASMALFGNNPFAARLPSTVCGLLTLSLVWFGVKKVAGRQRALLVRIRSGKQCIIHRRFQTRDHRCGIAALHRGR